MRVQPEARGIMMRSQDLLGIAGQLGRQWHRRDDAAMGRAEAQPAVGLALHLEPLFVHRAVVSVA
jgi:hypothetical protein